MKTNFEKHHKLILNAFFALGWLFISGAQAGEYEQRVTVECIAKGGDEKVIAACITTKLTEAEIKKCLGMDPGECFGPNNEIRKAVNTAVNDVTKGPGENNDLVGRKGWLRQRLGF
jgi:hypothetical protein